MKLNYRTYRIKLAAAALLSLPMLVLAADPPPADSAMWQKLRPALFQGRAINENGDQVIELIVPQRAQDAAVMPVSIKAKFAQTADHYIKTVHLILDNNPAPVAGVFHLTPASGRADLETRVRVEQYTYVRAIAETNDGALSMVSKYVKASGGCSAPSNRDSAAAANLGKMKLQLVDGVSLNQPAMVQLMIRHPNASGLAVDQLTHLQQPPHYVRTIQVDYAGKPVLSAEIDISISENPNFRFYFKPKTAGAMTAHAVDSDDLRFDTSMDVSPL